MKAQTQHALRYALRHPGRELSLVPRRLYHLYKHDHWAFGSLGSLHEDSDTGEVRRQVLSPPWEERWALLADACFFAVLALVTKAADLKELRASFSKQPS